jgi:hypothetical protein
MLIFIHIVYVSTEQSLMINYEGIQFLRASTVVIANHGEAMHRGKLLAILEHNLRVFEHCVWRTCPHWSLILKTLTW